MRMNLMRKMFCEYYLGECKGNAEQAALKAGYSAKCARQTAYKLLQDVQIKAYIEQRCKEIETENIANIQEIQMFWTSIIRDEEQPTKNRLRASELLAKAKCMFNNEW